MRITTMDMKKAVIINDVGLEVGFLSQPCTVDPLDLSDSLIVRSIKRQTIRQSTRIRPKNSMRAGVLRKRLFTIASSLRNPKLRSTMSCALYVERISYEDMQFFGMLVNSTKHPASRLDLDIAASSNSTLRASR